MNLVRLCLNFCSTGSHGVNACTILRNWPAVHRVRVWLQSPAFSSVAYGNLFRSTSLGGESSKMAVPENTSKKVQASSIVNCHLQVLGTGGGELKPCLLLFTDTKRYLFNCAENAQRFSNEYRVRHSKLRHLFVTRLDWNNVGGLCGLTHHLSSFQDAQTMGSFRLHGPDALSELITAMRFQIRRDKIQLEARDTVEAVGGFHLPVFRDENLTVCTLSLHAKTDSVSSIRSPTPSPSGDGIALTAKEEEEGEVREEHSPVAKRARISLSPQDHTTSIFLCKLVDVRGKFNSQKAADLGLSPGPQYKKLLQGESVVAPNGRVIDSSDVLGPTRIGPSFVVLECPSDSYVPAITSHPLLQRKAFDDLGQNLMLVVHITPRHVLESEAYSQWMASLGPDTSHLLLHETVCSRDWFLRGFLKTHGPLNLMCPSVFRMLAPSDPNGSPEKLKLVPSIPPEKLIVGQTLLRFHLKPSQKVGLDETQTLPPFSTYKKDLMSKIRSNREVKRALKRVSIEEEQGSPQRKRSLSPSSPPPPSLPVPVCGSDLVVTFLGTGASCPSKYRNVSSILIQTGYSGNILFDCGEGTLSQLYRHFGREEGDNILAEMGKIFISHMHGDHNLGLISILNRRAEVLKERAPGSGSHDATVVLGPKVLLWWLREYHNKCQRICYNFVESYKHTLRSGFLGGDKNISFLTVPVDHCKQAYGVVVERGSDWKVVYSGDTRPCPELAKAGRNATLLIHEATLDDDMLAEAKDKKHCTISEALGIAEQMNADFTILTHFSQRYCKIIPPILSKAGLKSRVFVAFDHMTVSLSEVQRLPSLLPAVQEVFSNTTDEDEMMNAAVSLGW